MNKLAPLLIILLAMYGCAPQTETIEEQGVNKIILLIGDGMGTDHIFAGMLANGSKLNMERAQYIGFSKTASASDLITDSGAGGTALATGKKTYNRAISVDTDTLPLKTILEIAEEHNLATGVLATCGLTHATPASFIAHQKTRYEYEQIAADYLDVDFDIAIGGARLHFEERQDGANISDSLKAKGYNVVYSVDDIQPAPGKKIICFVADEHPEKVLDGRGNYFPNALKKTLEQLSTNQNGFFVMAEGSQIDWGGHDNDGEYVSSEVIDFDKAVGVAFDYADNNPGTLVVVTADHETGGMAINAGELGSTKFEAGFTTENHSATMVPVMAYGTGAENFAGIYENTEVFHKMLKAFQFKK